MRDTLRADLTTAIKARDRIAIAALRSAMSAIDNAEAVPVLSEPAAGSEHVAGAVAGLGAAEAERRQLTDDDVRSIIETELGERSVAATEYERLDRTDDAERLRAEAAVLSRYLP
jgi:hypothetical protein